MSRKASRSAAPAGFPPTSRRSLHSALLRWYDAAARDLPWRSTRDPYAIWLSEVMLQQTRVDVVIDYYHRFLAAAPSVARLAALDESQLLKLWQGLGYYSRARNLHRAARDIVTQHGGALPRSAAALRTLPGVGAYTAAAVASIAFGEPVAVVDGNVKRVLARLMQIDAPIDAPAMQPRLWQLAQELLEPRRPGDFNQALMELGATICTPRAPRCDACPVRRWCRAQQAGVATSLPTRIRKPSVPKVVGLAALISRGGRWLMVQRPRHGQLAGLWGLPGVMLSAISEGPASQNAHHATLILALRRQLQVSVRVGRRLGEVRHVFTHRDLWLTIFQCVLPGGSVVQVLEGDAAWVNADEAARLPVSRLDQKALQLCADALSR